MKKPVVLLIILGLSGCATIPLEITKAHSKELEIIQTLETSHLAMVDSFIDQKIVVFEAAIDLMSYVDITKDFESNMIALGMLADAPLATFLEEHPQITTIRFCLDSDEPGKKATEELLKKYYELGFEVENVPPPVGFKDFNECLIATRLPNLGVATKSIAKIK